MVWSEEKCDYEISRVNKSVSSIFGVIQHNEHTNISELLDNESSDIFRINYMKWCL